MNETTDAHTTRILAALIPKPRPDGETLTKQECAELLSEVGDPEAPEILGALQELQRAGVVALDTRSPQAWLRILQPDEVGPVRLLRSFVNKHYGDVSPRVPEKMIRSLFKRHGAKHELGTPAVEAALARVEALGLVRVLKAPDAYVKMLGKDA